MKATAPEYYNFSGGGGKLVSMNTRPKIPKLSISTALWKGSFKLN